MQCDAARRGLQGICRGDVPVAALFTFVTAVPSFARVTTFTMLAWITGLTLFASFPTRRFEGVGASDRPGTAGSKGTDAASLKISAASFFTASEGTGSAFAATGGATGWAGFAVQLSRQLHSGGTGSKGRTKDMARHPINVHLFRR